MRLEDLEVYGEAMAIGEKIWDLVGQWAYFPRDTVGKQWVRSADSIAANLAEGFGRFSYNENKLFCFYARGSLYETITWLNKAAQRNLIPSHAHGRLTDELTTLGKKLNAYINSIGKPPKKPTTL